MKVSKKNAGLHIRMSEEEKAEIDKFAGGLGMSEYLLGLHRRHKVRLELERRGR